jgi:hypothetical protein
MNTTRQLVQSAFESLLLKARREGKAAPTIASVAARAKVSRSSMYGFYADVVAQIQGLSARKQTARQSTLLTKVRLLRQQLKTEKELTKALARACIELAAQKTALADELEEERLRFQLRMQHIEHQAKGTRAMRVLRGDRTS